MKRLGKEPRLLPNVMEAIANLKEKAGSTQKKIVEHISHQLKKSKDNSRNITMQIRRALDHGIHSGLIKQNSGKFLLCLDNKDYAIFERFRKMSDRFSDITQARRRGRRGRKRGRGRRRRGRRRGRRHAELDGYSDEVSESESRSALGTPEPMDRGRRGRRRRRRRSRRGRRRGGKHGRKHAVASDNSDSDVSPTKKSSEEDNKPEKRRSYNDNLNYQKPPIQGGCAHTPHSLRDYQDRPSRNQPRDDDANDCGNPDCLCSIKQEEDLQDSRYTPHDTDGYYHHDYMN